MTFPLRLSAEMEHQLSNASRDTGIPRVVIVRRLLRAYLDGRRIPGLPQLKTPTTGAKAGATT